MNRPISQRSLVLAGVLAVLLIVALTVWFWPGRASVPPEAQARSEEINQSMNAASPPAPAEPAPIQRAPRGAVKVK